MNARSLVGMTMGARKRAAAYEARHTWDRIDWHAIGNKNNWQREWRTITRKRLSLHIGQRLRPCPNCMKCWPWRRSENGHMGAVAPPAGAGKRYQRLELYDICDGSGVIPAKARKVRR